jgi:lipopolysaccharide transport system ATP-binding protein
MNDIAIRVENLSKRYRIGKPANSQNGGKSFISAISAPFNYLASSLREPSSNEIFWALRGISFEVKRGEVIGIIGRNGAGKSTLLKILSRITQPTQGRALVNGRIGSLLEVGTGFHPELTGRENIYLNGAILGMKKDEIDRKFDEIVAFAEVEKFISTPVKRYSSGMYVRLAFSVAAHLEPEILLIDEVLAVGDLSFQQKCLHRLKTLTSKGMTILLVSHNMTAIQSSCKRAIYLDNGEVASSGETLDVIKVYQQALQRTNGYQNADHLPEDNSQREENKNVSIVGFEMSGEDGIPRSEFKFGESIQIRIDLHAKQRIKHPMINFGIRRGDGVVVCNFNNWYDNFKIDYIKGLCTLEGWLPPLRLVPEFYEIHVLVWPWGGGHLVGDLSRTRPLAWSKFGSFRITGPALNAHDGVFQVPALKWRFQSESTTMVFDDIREDNMYRAFDDDASLGKY